MKGKIEILAYCVLGALCGILGYDTLIGLHADRRYVLYGIRRELTPGVSRQRIEEIVAAHDAPFLHKKVSERNIVLGVDLGMAHSCFLTLSYSEDELVAARIRAAFPNDTLILIPKP
jgi:hypothetical protein